MSLAFRLDKPVYLYQDKKWYKGMWDGFHVRGLRAVTNNSFICCPLFYPSFHPIPSSCGISLIIISPLHLCLCSPYSQSLLYSHLSFVCHHLRQLYSPITLTGPACLPAAGHGASLQAVARGLWHPPMSTRQALAPKWWWSLGNSCPSPAHHRDLPTSYRDR